MRDIFLEPLFEAILDKTKFLKLRKPLLKRYTDSLFLFDLLTNATMPTEKHLIIVLSRFKYANNNEEVDNLYSNCSEFNITEALTKGKTDSSLFGIIKTRIVCLPVEQWFQKSKPRKCNLGKEQECWKDQVTGTG